MGSVIEYQLLKKKHVREVINTYHSNFWDGHPASRYGKIKMTTSVHDWLKFYDEYGGYGIVGYADDKLASAYWGMLSPWQYNESKLQGMELLYFILPEYRHGKLFVNFLEQIDKVNRENNVDFYNLNVPYEQAPLADKLLSGYGFEPDGINLRKDIT